MYSKWVKIRSGRGILIYSAWPGLNFEHFIPYYFGLKFAFYAPVA